MKKYKAIANNSFNNKKKNKQTLFPSTFDIREIPIKCTFAPRYIILI